MKKLLAVLIILATVVTALGASLPAEFASAVDLAADTSVLAVIGKGGQCKYFKFVPVISGFYSLDLISDSFENDAQGTIYDSDGNKTGDSYTARSYYVAGREYYIEVKFVANNIKGSIVVCVKTLLTEDDLAGITALSADVPVTADILADGKRTYFMFKPGAGGLYKIDLSGGYYAAGIIYDAKFNHIGYNFQPMNFKAGNEYYIEIVFYQEDALGSYSVCVKTLITENDLTAAPRLQVDTPYTFSALAGGQTHCYKYTPSASGNYTFISNASQRTHCSVYYTGTEDGEISFELVTEKHSEGNNFYADTYLNAGMDYYFCVGFTDEHQSGSFSIRLETFAKRVENAPALVENTVAHATATSGGQISFFKYTPKTSGNYVYYSKSEEVTVGTLFNAEGFLVSSDFFSGDNNNFESMCSLEKDTDYYFGVRYGDADNSGTIPVFLDTFEKYMDKATGITLGKSFDARFYSTQYFSFTPDYTGIYTLSTDKGVNALVNAWLYDSSGKMLAERYTDFGWDDEPVFAFVYKMNAGIKYFYKIRAWDWGAAERSVFPLKFVGTNLSIPSATPAPTQPETPPPTTPGDANCDGKVNIEDILLIRDVIFGIGLLKPQGYINLKLKTGDPIRVDQILLVRDVIFDISADV